MPCCGVAAAPSFIRTAVVSTQWKQLQLDVDQAFIEIIKQKKQ